MSHIITFEEAPRRQVGWRCSCGDASGISRNQREARKRFDSHVDRAWAPTVIPIQEFDADRLLDGLV